MVDLASWEVEVVFSMGAVVTPAAVTALVDYQNLRTSGEAVVAFVRLGSVRVGRGEFGLKSLQHLFRRHVAYRVVQGQGAYET